MTGEIYRYININCGLGLYPTQFESPVLNVKTENEAAILAVQFPTTHVDYRKIIDIGYYTASEVYNIESYELTYSDALDRYIFMVDRQFSYGDKAYFQFRALHVDGQEIVDPGILFLRFFRSIKSVDFASIDSAPSGTQTEILEDFIQQHGNVNASTIHTGHVRIDNDTIVISGSGVISTVIQPQPTQTTIEKETVMAVNASSTSTSFIKNFTDSEDNIISIVGDGIVNIITDKKEPTIKLFRFPSKTSDNTYSQITPEKEFILLDFDVSEFSSSTQIISASLVLPIKYATENEWNDSDGDITIPNFFRCYNLESEPPGTPIETHRYTQSASIINYETRYSSETTYSWEFEPTGYGYASQYFFTTTDQAEQVSCFIKLTGSAVQYSYENTQGYGTNNTLEFYKVLEDWDYGSITYSNKPAIESTPFRVVNVDLYTIYNGYIENPELFPYGVCIKITGGPPIVYYYYSIYANFYFAALDRTTSPEWKELEFEEAQAYIGTEYIKSTDVGLGWSEGKIDVTEVIKGWIDGTVSHIALGLVLNDYGSDYFTCLGPREITDFNNIIHLDIKTASQIEDRSIKNFNIQTVHDEFTAHTSADIENDNIYIYSYSSFKDIKIEDSGVVVLASYPVIEHGEGVSIFLFDGEEYAVENSGYLYVSKKINGMWGVVYTSTDLETEKYQQAVTKDEEGVYISFSRYDQNTKEIVLKYLEYSNGIWKEEEVIRLYDTYSLHSEDIGATMSISKKDDKVVIAVPHIGYKGYLPGIAFLIRDNGVWRLEDCNLFDKDNQLYANSGFGGLEIEDIKITSNGILLMYRFNPALHYMTVYEMRAIYVDDSGWYHSFGHIGSPLLYYGPDGHSNIIIKDNGEIYTSYGVPHTHGNISWIDIVLRYIGNLNDL